MVGATTILYNYRDMVEGILLDKSWTSEDGQCMKFSKYFLLGHNVVLVADAVSAIFDSIYYTHLFSESIVCVLFAGAGGRL